MNRIPELKIIPYGGERKFSARAIWGRRLALVSIAVISIYIILFRVGLFEFDTVLTGMIIAVFGALIAFVLSVWAIFDIRRQRNRGMKTALTGMIAGAAIILLPLSQIYNYIFLPSISDISTDLQKPPPFSAMNDQQSRSQVLQMNQSNMNAELQLQAYPDIRPMLLRRGGTDAYNIVYSAAEKLNWKVVAAYPPSSDGMPGQIQAIDRTSILGLKSDIAVRIVTDGKQSTVDVRSASRSTSHDLGNNADKIRRLFANVQILMLDVSNQAQTTSDNITDYASKSNVNTKPVSNSIANDELSGGTKSHKEPAKGKKVTAIDTNSTSELTSAISDKELDISNSLSRTVDNEQPVDPNKFEDQIFEPKGKLPPVDPLQRRETDSNELANASRDGTDPSANSNEESLSGYIPEGEIDDLDTTTPEEAKPKKYKKSTVKRSSSSWQELIKLALPDGTE